MGSQSKTCLTPFPEQGSGAGGGWQHEPHTVSGLAQFPPGSAPSGAMPHTVALAPPFPTGFPLQPQLVSGVQLQARAGIPWCWLGHHSHGEFSTSLV